MDQNTPVKAPSSSSTAALQNSASRVRRSASSGPPPQFITDVVHWIEVTNDRLNKNPTQTLSPADVLGVLHRLTPCWDKAFVQRSPQHTHTALRLMRMLLGACRCGVQPRQLGEVEVHRLLTQLVSITGVLTLSAAPEAIQTLYSVFEAIIDNVALTMYTSVTRFYSEIVGAVLSSNGDDVPDVIAYGQNRVECEAACSFLLRLISGSLGRGLVAVPPALSEALLACVDDHARTTIATSGWECIEIAISNSMLVHVGPVLHGVLGVLWSQVQRPADAQPGSHFFLAISGVMHSLIRTSPRIVASWVRDNATTFKALVLASLNTKAAVSVASFLEALLKFAATSTSVAVWAAVALAPVSLDPAVLSRPLMEAHVACLNRARRCIVDVAPSVSMSPSAAATGSPSSQDERILTAELARKVLCSGSREPLSRGGGAAGGAAVLSHDVLALLEAVVSWCDVVAGCSVSSLTETSCLPFLAAATACMPLVCALPEGRPCETLSTQLGALLQKFGTSNCPTALISVAFCTFATYAIAPPPHTLSAALEFVQSKCTTANGTNDTTNDAAIAAMLSSMPAPACANQCPNFSAVISTCSKRGNVAVREHVCACLGNVLRCGSVVIPGVRADVDRVLDAMACDESPLVRCAVVAALKTVCSPEESKNTSRAASVSAPRGGAGTTTSLSRGRGGRKGSPRGGGKGSKSPRPTKRARSSSKSSVATTVPIVDDDEPGISIPHRESSALGPQLYDDLLHRFVFLLKDSDPTVVVAMLSMLKSVPNVLPDETRAEHLRLFVHEDASVRDAAVALVCAGRSPAATMIEPLATLSNDYPGKAASIADGILQATLAGNTGPYERSFQRAASILLHFATSEVMEVQARAHLALTALVQSKGTSVFALLTRNPAAYATLVVSASRTGNRVLERALEDYTERDLPSLYDETSAQLLPVLVLHRDKKTIAYLGEIIASAQQQTGSNVMCECCTQDCGHIVAGVLCDALLCEEKGHVHNTVDALEFLLSVLLENKVLVNDIAEVHEKQIVERIFEIASHSVIGNNDDVLTKKVVLTALARLHVLKTMPQALNTRQYEPAVAAVPSSAILDLLFHNSFGLLDDVCKRIGVGREDASGTETARTSLHDRTCGLRSLNLVVSLLGTHVVAIAQKIHPILLKAAETFPDVLHEVVMSWCVFVGALGDDYMTAHARDMAVDVSVFTRSEMFHSNAEFRHDVIRLVTMIAEKHCSATALAAIVDLFPECDGLDTLFRKVRSNKKGGSTADMLATCIEAMRSESSNCRLAYIQRTYEQLQTRQSELLGFILNDSDDVPGATTSTDRGLLSAFVAEMLTATRDSPQIALIAAGCLGLVGAVDPMRMSVRVSRDKSQRDISSELLSHTSFAREAVTKHLLRALHTTSDPRMHDRAAFAIQSLIRICCTLPSGEQASLPDLEAGKCTWWTQLGTSVQTQLRSFVRTTYETKVVHSRDRRVPEYTPAMPYIIWLRLWLTNITSRTTGPNGAVFQALRNVSKRDTKLAVFSLPYILHSVVTCGTDADREELAMEIRTVFSDAGRATEHVQLLFGILDGLGRWCDSREAEMVRSSSKSSSSSPAVDPKIKAWVTNARAFTRSISVTLCAEAAHTIKASARAVMYAELHYRNQRRKKSNSTSTSTSSSSSGGTTDAARLLQRVYAGLNEPDGLLGLSTLRSHTTLSEKALDYETAGRWPEAVQCNELLLQRSHGSDDAGVRQQHQVAMLRCLRNLGQFSLVYEYAKSVLSSTATTASCDQNTFRDFTAQSAWRLGRWDAMEELSAVDELTTFDASVSRALLSLRNVVESARSRINDEDTGGGDLAKAVLGSQQVTEATRKSLISALAAASMESYDRAYPYVLQLHLLADIDTAARCAAATTNSDGDMCALHGRRMGLLEASFKSQEPILAVQRTIYSMLNMRTHVALTWVDQARQLRKAGVVPAALSAILQACAEEGSHSGLQFTHHLGKILYMRGDHLDAIAELESAARSPKLASAVTGTAALNKLKAKLLLYSMRYNIETNQRPHSDVKEAFEEIIQLNDTSEKAFFYLADFLDRVYQAHKTQFDTAPAPVGGAADETEREHIDIIDTHIPSIIAKLGAALARGHSHVYHALPKFLTRWLDAAQLLHSLASPPVVRGAARRSGGANASLALAALRRIHEEVDRCLPAIPPYIFLTALPQIVSRIGHRNEEVIARLDRIMQRVLTTFPQQALWYSYFVANSGANSEATHRSRVMNDIFKAAAKSSPVFAKLRADMAEIVKGFINLAGYQATTRMLALSRVASFRHALEALPSDVILPQQVQLNVRLPPVAGPADERYSFFPAASTMHTIDNDVAVIPSLQKPKRITIVGSSGTSHHFLCKAKDETRKDSRMMEYNAMINRLLSKDTEARRRRMYVRTFAALPLNDDCGIIEWVDNLTTLRSAVDSSYQRTSHGLTTAQIKAVKQRADEARKPMLRMYLDDILPHFPPQLHKWFLLHFPEPSQWFASRTNFTRTCAVYSIVGHIVGLGDRHGENLMLDEHTGDCVHVDFACLFDKGETLEVPERVRFRLTPNMVDAFGVTGVEGVFRYTAEIAMRVQQSNKDTLFGILESFVHDPLVEWGRSRGGERMDSTKILGRVHRRFDGYPDVYRDQCSHALGVEGVVQKLISSASAPDALAQMYIWWMPWL